MEMVGMVTHQKCSVILNGFLRLDLQFMMVETTKKNYFLQVKVVVIITQVVLILQLVIIILMLFKMMVLVLMIVHHLVILSLQIFQLAEDRFKVKLDGKLLMLMEQSFYQLLRTMMMKKQMERHIQMLHVQKLDVILLI